MSMEMVLELLKDGQWHDVSEVVQAIKRPVKQIKEMLRFYEKFYFIEFDKRTKRIMIDPKIRELFLINM